MSFIVFLVRFVENGPKTAKSGKIRGVLCSGVVIPRSSKGPRSGKRFPRRSMAKKEDGPASSSPRHSRATPQQRASSQ